MSLNYVSNLYTLNRILDYKTLIPFSSLKNIFSKEIEKIKNITNDIKINFITSELSVFTNKNSQCIEFYSDLPIITDNIKANNTYQNETNSLIRVIIPITGIYNEFYPYLKHKRVNEVIQNCLVIDENTKCLKYKGQILDQFQFKVETKEIDETYTFNFNPDEIIPEDNISIFDLDLDAVLPDENCIIKDF
jgi:hypothetical protein